MLLDYTARLHPLVIHFPIALLIVAACLDAWEFWRPSGTFTATTRLLLTVGAIGSVIAALTGWLLASQTRRPPELQSVLAWHRGLGVATVAVASLACVLAWERTPAPTRRRLRAALMIGAALLVAAAGHFGGMLVWGLDYFAP